MVGQQLHAALKGGGRLLKVTQLFLNQPKNPIGAAEEWIPFDSTIAFLQSCLELSPIVVDARNVAGNDLRNRVEGLRELDFLKRVIQSAEWDKTRYGIPMTRGCRPGIEFDGPPVFQFRAVPVPILRRLDVCKRGVPLRKFVIEEDSRCCIRGSLRPDLCGSQHAVVREQRIRVGKPRVSWRIARVFSDRFLEEFHSLSQAGIGTLAAVITTL